jgi:hypothetical protein
VRRGNVTTEYAIPLWIFLSLFLLLPLVAVVLMTLQRKRSRAGPRRGFDVLPKDQLGNERRE